MNLYFRFIILIAKSIFYKRKKDPFTACKTNFWVNPLDLDINMHMNNGRYLSIMDLGRMDLMIKSGIFWKLFSKGFYPVVASEGIRFKKSLEPFQFFELVTQIESWDEKDFYMSQKFYHKRQIVAEGYIKGRFKQRGRKGSVPTKELFEMITTKQFSVQMSELAKSLASLEKNLGQN